MRIPVIHIITMLELGGAQENTLYTVTHLDTERFKPYLLSGPGGILDSEAEGLEEGSVFFVPNLRREIRPLEDFIALRQMRRKIREILKENQNIPAIVHTHSSKAGILGRWAARIEGIPVVIHTFHGFGFNKWQPWPLRLLFQLAEILTSKVTDGFIMVSRANAEEALSLGITRGKKTVLIRSGISLKQFSFNPELRGRIRKELGLKDDSRIVTQISCFKPQKAPLDFVKVASQVAKVETNVSFLLVGDGILRPHVESEIRRFGLEGRVHLLGWRRDIPEILHDTDVLVLTSLWEGLPRVLPQAMAVGVPAVVTAVDGSPEAIRDGVNGFVVRPRDVDGMAERVVRLLRDPDLRLKMGEEGRRRVGEFDIEEMVRKQEDFYTELMETKLKGRFWGESRCPGVGSS